MNFEHFYDAECAFKSIEDIAGKHVTVMGLGLNGGGIASALFFSRHGAFVTITDMKTEAELAPSVEAITASVAETLISSVANAAPHTANEVTKSAPDTNIKFLFFRSFNFISSPLIIL